MGKRNEYSHLGGGAYTGIEIRQILPVSPGAGVDPRIP